MDCSIYGCGAPGPIARFREEMLSKEAARRCPEVIRYRNEGPVETDGYFRPRRLLMHSKGTEPLASLLERGYRVLETERLPTDDAAKYESGSESLLALLARDAVGPKGRYLRFFVAPKGHASCSVQSNLLRRQPERGLSFASYGLTGDYCIAAENTDELATRYHVREREVPGVTHVYFSSEWEIWDRVRGDYHARLQIDRIDPPPSWYVSCGEHGYLARKYELSEKTLRPPAPTFSKPAGVPIRRQFGSYASVSTLAVARERALDDKSTRFGFGSIRPHIEANVADALYFGDYYRELYIVGDDSVARFQLLGFAPQFSKPRLLGGKIWLVGLGHDESVGPIMESRPTGWVLRLSRAGELEMAVPFLWSGIPSDPTRVVRIEEFDIQRGRLNATVGVYVRAIAWSSDSWLKEREIVLTSDAMMR